MKRAAAILLMITLMISCFLLQGCGNIDIDDINYGTSSNKELTAEELYELVSPSVVEITGEAPLGTNTGTGFFYDNKGTVVTNYHVIEGCTSAEVTLANGSSYKVDKVLGYSVDRDIAILSTKCTSSTPLKIRETAVKTGETVYAIGSSLGLSGSLSDGIVSAAEREVDDQTYIQTTAPISHGNSGGPLLDKEGKVVGITSASFIDGQNLNLAIPIKEVANISTKNPLTLGEVFDQTGHEVEWLSDYRFQYYEEEDTYVLLFQLADKNENPMSAIGTVDIRIVNNDGASVYEKKHSFSEDNFEEWVYDDVNEMYLATIYISPSSIDSGSTEYGTVFFEVYGNDYGFEECSIEVFDLPTKSLTIQLPQLPLTVHDYGYSSKIQASLRIDSITYEKVYEDSLYIYFSGEKTYDVEGNNSDSWISFDWKLYDSENYLVDHGTFYTDSISVGDKFKNKDVFVAGGIKAGENYKLVIVGAEENNDEETQIPDIPKTQKVTSLGNYSLTTQSDNTKYALSFVLNDQDGKSMSNSGQIEIKIVNNLGVTVYSNTRSFYKNDFQIIGSASDQKYQLTILVDKEDIDTDFSSEGTFCFSISGSEFTFEEKSITITDLPSITVQNPNTPLYVNTISFNASSGSYGVSHTVRIDSFSYEIDMFGNLSIYCSGEKTYDIKGSSSTYFCEMNWRLYDSDGNLIDYGWDTVSGLKVGDKFKDHKINITTINIIAGESYRLEVFDSSYE